MSVKCKILLVLLNLFYSINGDADEGLILTSDRTTEQTLANKSAARHLQQWRHIELEIKGTYWKPGFRSTRYWNASPSTKESSTSHNKLKTTTKKKETTTTSNEITPTTKKKKTGTPHKITPTTIKKITTPNKIKEKTALSTTDSGASTSTQDKSTTLNSNVSTIDDDSSKTDTTNKITTRATKNINKKTAISKKKKSDSTKKGVLNNVQAAEKRVNKAPSLNPYDLKNDLLKIMSYFPNANATAEVIGRSVEYKDIVLLKITDANIEDKKIAREDKNEMEEESKSEVKIGREINTEGKKIIFIVHGLSTFELWKIPCLYEEMQFKLLISFYLSHLKNFDIFLIPVANPDGFTKKDNLWNKNVSPQEDCGGVDLDRNFDVAWSSRSNVFSCDQLYPGPTPFSERESEAVKDVFLQYGNKMAAYIHVHATDNNFDYRGNTVLIPKGYTDAESDEDKYLDMKGEIDEAMRKANFDVVSVNMKTVYSWYGPVAGTSVDYASEVIKVPFAMEFLMQPYPTDIKDIKKDLNQAALTHIWKRVIDTVFHFLHKINNSDESA